MATIANMLLVLFAFALNSDFVAAESLPLSKPFSAIAESRRLESLKTCDEVLERNKKPLPPSDSFAPKWVRRLILLANLPAYAWESRSIQFRLEQPGLQLELQQGPFQGWDQRQPVQLDQFRLIYRPENHPRFSILRKLFGPVAREFNLQHLVSAREEALNVDDGTVLTLEISLDPEDKTTALVLISRDTGQVRILEGARSAGDQSLWASRIRSAWTSALSQRTNLRLRETPGTWSATRE